MKNKTFKYDGRSRPSDDLYRKNFDRIFNPTLTKNMPNVKWKEIPPVRGPNPQGVNNGRTVQNSNKQMVTRKKVT
tara:strand:- start:387 stop:611 length:225 start_codon:yes stop_codon:yes gene_type:complete